MKRINQILPQVIKRLERSASEAAAKKHLALIDEMLAAELQKLNPIHKTDRR